MHLPAFLILISTILISGCAAAVIPPKAQPSSTGRSAPETAVSRAESQLADLINELRVSEGLSPVPVSASLYLTAKGHLRDLVLNAPDKNKFDKRGLPCGMHSWSAAGGREALCYTADHYYAKGMWKKPEEVAGYKGKGYEIIYWKSLPATPEAAIEAWKRSRGERDVILEEGVWKGRRWQAMGAGIEGNYAAVWFGDRVDGKGVVTAE